MLLYPKDIEWLNSHASKNIIYGKYVCTFTNEIIKTKKVKVEIITDGKKEIYLITRPWCPGCKIKLDDILNIKKTNLICAKSLVI